MAAADFVARTNDAGVPHVSLVLRDVGVSIVPNCERAYCGPPLARLDRYHFCALWFAITLLFIQLSFAGEVIDRIVATVNGRIILQSDLDEALSYEAVLNGRTPNQSTEDDRRAVLDRLIDQELLREQMKSADFKHASETEATARVAEARKQYPEAATDDGWSALLGKFGLTEKDLVSHVQQQIDLLRLVDARLRPSVQIDSKTVEDYYREKFVPQLTQAGAPEVALSDVSGKIRELLTAQRVNELLVSWLQTLRSESEVRVPGAAPSIQELQ
ncbi:MAG TPA: SurA N-terminal domain-containing protein [Candidatus Sulfotelmatobacter sp.]|nr:SurA N-terminal domain-containing protein [Candidatus Sulfotelmatobacter sp.]